MDTRFDDPRFELRGRLGSGGMGTVHRAFDRLHGREVALKIGRPSLGDEHDAARIGEEFAVLANLDHAGLVRVLDFGLTEQAAWLTSDIVSGPRLDVWAPRADAEAMVRVVVELIETLAWLHARGLVHGDVKPANVLVGASGPVLIDFGLAGSGEALFGATRAYAAPELLVGGAPSPASDLFALGRTLQRIAVGDARLTTLAESLTDARPERRPSSAEALAALGAQGVVLEPVRDGVPWAGAIERALRALELGQIDLQIARAHRGGFINALAARLMLAGRRAWVLPEGAGLEPFARVAAALGQAVVAPTGTLADDQKEVIDAFSDRLIGVLRAEGRGLPVLLVNDTDQLGAAGRFVLARLVEARALPGFAIVRGDHGLERGVQAALTTVAVLASEAAGRDWEADWAALTSEGRRVAREMYGLGGAARSDEIADAKRGFIALQNAGFTRRAAAGRTALHDDVIQAIDSVIHVAVGDDDRRRWLQVLTAATAPSEAMLRRRAQHAAALGDGAVAIASYLEAAREAETGFAWARAGSDRIAAGRLMLAAGDGERAFEEARAALRALAAGGVAGDEALTLASAAALAVRGPRAAVMHKALAIAKARAASERGANDEAVTWTSEVLADAARLSWKMRFEALLVRGTALSQTADKAGAERDLSAAAALAEAENDLHALGRTANNLGMLAFHRGDLNAAADAWARAAEAKAQSGDRRGERIGRHNRGLALRELGRLDEAAVAANEAAVLSDRIGDEVGRATASLAKAQLALDRGLVAEAEAALTTFAEIGWKPAMVQADGRIVRVRLELAKGELDAAERGAREALEAAIAARLEPVAAEAWALSVVIAGKALPVPELVAGPLARAADERGGLALLLLFVRAFDDAEAGRWGEAKVALGRAAKRLDEAPLPPAAKVGLPLALAAARLVDPAIAERLEGMCEGPREVGAITTTAVTDLPAWAQRLRTTLGASRVELVPLEGEVIVAGDGKARFGELGRRVAKSGEPFIAKNDGRIEAVAVPLRLGRVAVGALVAGFAEGGSPEALTAKASAATLDVVALAVAHELERRRRERAEAEVARLDAELRKHLEQHEAEVTALRDALEQSQSILSLRYEYEHIVHRSAAMRRILETLDKVTDRELPVLILGESGVGKELLARALHFNGPRSKKRFIAENCGAIPKDLFESQFFGHVKGAFTGALAPRQGLFEAAEGGTLFLDEVGELPLEMQVKLLRVLQDRVVRPVGSNREIAVDFRLVCATNRDLAQMVQEGRFREDLFYRIAVVRIDVPPLRKRPEDIVPIAERLVAMHAQRLGRSVRLSPEAADRLAAYPFPGNVRELDNELLRALALSEGSEIKPRHLSAAIQGKSEPRRRSHDDSALETLEATFLRVEKDILIKHLRASRGQKVAAAKSLGLSRPGLDAKLARHGIDAKELARTLKEQPR